MTKAIPAILFLCTGNSCRSQMAEGFAKKLFPPNWKVYSAGTHPMTINPLAVEVMKEAGVDISGQYSKGLNDVPLSEIDLIVTLCGSARENCAVFPSKAKSEHWPIPDPYDDLGTPLAKKSYQNARDDIKKRVQELVERVQNK